MRTIRISNQYKRDLDLARKRRFPIEKLNEVITLLANDIPLPVARRDHALKGYSPVLHECHILPDWLLVYRKIDDNSLHLLQLIRTGSHSDIFKM